VWSSYYKGFHNLSGGQDEQKTGRIAAFGFFKIGGRLRREHLPAALKIKAIIYIYA
jgi:hypothetical protein